MILDFVSLFPLVIYFSPPNGDNLLALSAVQREDATISIVHSRTKNPEVITREADIIISAVGQPNMVRGNWIKPGAVIIDVGINPVEVSKLCPVSFSHKHKHLHFGFST